MSSASGESGGHDEDGSPSRSLLARALTPITRVHDRELIAVLCLLSSVFLILTAYYLIKPAREGWLAVSAIAGLSKLEIKAYASFGQVMLLIGIVRLYTGLVMSWPRGALVARVTLFLTSNLVLFWALQPSFLVEEVPYLGVAFYLWVGIFSVFIVAQFWAYVADFYTVERGRRLVPLVALGANAGAVFGAWAAEFLVRQGGVRSLDLILIASVPLVVSLALLVAAERVGPASRGLEESDRPVTAQTAEASRSISASESGSMGAIELIRSHRLLSATAALTILLGWVGSNGENLLFAAVQGAVELEAIAEGVGAEQLEAFTLAATTSFYGNFYFWVNLLGFALQALVVARLLQFGGFGTIFLCLPVISLLGYAAMSVLPILGVIKLAKIFENSTNYSINNTARSVLWLPLSTEMKFKAKQAIDTIFIRVGDGLAALTVLLGVNWLAISPFRIFWLNVILCVGWIILAHYIIQERRKLLPENL